MSGTSSSPWFYQGAEGSSFVQAGKVFGVINLSLDKKSPPLTEKTMDSKKQIKVITNYITYFFFGHVYTFVLHVLKISLLNLF